MLYYYHVFLLLNKFHTFLNFLFLLTVIMVLNRVILNVSFFKIREGKLLCPTQNNWTTTIRNKYRIKVSILRKSFGIKIISYDS